MLKTDPQYGVYPWWPEDGDDWLHPEDVIAARQMIPSWRVFRRDGRKNSYSILHYGAVRLRARPTLWIKMHAEGYDLGNWVEVKSRGIRNTPRTGIIREMRYNPWSKRIEYQIHDTYLPIETHYHAEDLRHIEPIQPNTWSHAIQNPSWPDNDDLADLQLDPLDSS